MLRETAYKVVQTEAMQAWQTDGDFQQGILYHPEIRQYLSEEKLAESFSLTRQLGNVDRIFERVFGS